MDIPVSRLNNRMALQLPQELPLGLVFVVGEVRQLHGDEQTATCRIQEGEHFIRCRLTPRAAADAELSDGQRVRAGGHLVFDTQAAHYYLLARDIETVPDRDGPPGEEQPAGTFESILDDVRRRSEASSLATAELPPWVKKLAPPEVRAEWDGDESLAWDDILDDEAGAGATPTPGVAAAPGLTGESELTDELFRLLSEAMDSDEEVELTPLMLAELSLASRDETAVVPPAPPAAAAPRPDVGPEQAALDLAPRPVDDAPPRRTAQARPAGTDWSLLVFGLVIGMMLMLVIGLGAWALVQYVSGAPLPFLVP